MNGKKNLLGICILLIQLLVSTANANVLGNMQTLAPNPDSLIFQNVHSSQTLGKNYFNIGVFAAYVRNELSVYDNLVNPHFVNYKDKAYTFDLVFAWGVTEHLELTYSMPGYFKQEADSGQSQDNFISEGINGHRIGAKYDISQSKTGGFAVASSVDLTVTRNNPYIGNSPLPIWNFELIWDHRDRDSGFGFNLGYRKRTPGDPVPNSYFLPVGDQMIGSAAYVYGLSKKWRFHAELFGSYGLQKDNHPEQTYISSLEVLLGGKYRFARNWFAHYGVTIEALPKGLAPDYRLYVGLNHFFGFHSKETSAPSTPPDSSFAVLPGEINVAPNEKQIITIRGGTGPFQYEIADGLGSFNEATLEYTAPDKVGDDDLTVTDSTGATITVPIHVHEKESGATEALQVNPPDANVYTGGVVQLTVTGGEAPYKATLEPKSFGRISSKTMNYKAPTKTGDVTITITDKQSHTVTTLIHVVPVPKAAKAVVLKNLNFIFNTSKLTPDAKKELDKNLANMSQVKVKKIIVAGHTDSKGSAEYNQELSQNRAETVAEILRQRFSGIEIEAVGFGKTQPIATNKTEKGRLTNRRVELKLYYSQ